MPRLSAVVCLLIALSPGEGFSIGRVRVIKRRQTIQKEGQPKTNNGNSCLFAKSPNDEDNLKDANERGMFDFLSPYESNIPNEIKAEIYEAEGRTPAAQDRTTRVIVYTSLGVICVLFAFFNGFLTELRTTPNPDGAIVPLDELGFGWVSENPISSFLFMNKLGGGLCLLLGGGSALLAEAEFDTRRINAEKIYEEMVRRRTARESKQQTVTTKKKKKRRNKTLEALAEVLAEDVSPTAGKVEQEEVPMPAAKVEPPKPSGNLLDKMKDMYNKADTMAASQALLLNKKLEDEGILEKITDESGLKVIGKDAAGNKAKPSDSESDLSKSNKG